MYILFILNPKMPIYVKINLNSKGKKIDKKTFKVIIKIHFMPHKNAMH